MPVTVGKLARVFAITFTVVVAFLTVDNFNRVKSLQHAMDISLARVSTIDARLTALETRHKQAGDATAATVRTLSHDLEEITQRYESDVKQISSQITNIEMWINKLEDLPDNLGTQLDAIIKAVEEFRNFKKEMDKINVSERLNRITTTLERLEKRFSEGGGGASSNAILVKANKKTLDAALTELKDSDNTFIIALTYVTKTSYQSF